MRTLANTWVSWANKVLASVCIGWHIDLSEDAHKILAAYGLRHSFQTYRNARNAAARKGTPTARGRAASKGPRRTHRSPSNRGRQSAPPRTRMGGGGESPVHDGCDGDSISDRRHVVWPLYVLLRVWL